MNEKRINERAAGYMELAGAQKDGDCQVIEVEGGISRDKGCCSNFWPPTAKKFNCGACDYVADGTDQPEEERPISRRDARKMTDLEIINSNRPAKEYK